ncbi:hypothetical protein HPP92_014796 [Vanilla planifolia]|uniref:Gelsolin-like domain-containing protein n=1 Tax=Vanilla planifolia TaxID=51239 RepID=A0A835QRP2_VANPL|nr:hypothetical protein HPP92_014796 [Vanilla planifolia]
MWRSGIDEAFRGAGVKAGLEVWCLENLMAVPIPKSLHGKFFSGSAYIVLRTFVLRNGNYQHDIHYWLGNNAEMHDSNMASDKALELDAALGSRAVHYREVQGSETEKFLSYFKPCIIPVEGVFTSKLQGNGNEAFRLTMFSCKGDHAVRVQEVPFCRSSLNHDEVFIVDTQSKIFLFSGCNSTIQERAKALEVVQYLNENQHGGRCEVATIEDGKFVGDSDAGEFWNLFGGYAPIARELPDTRQTEKYSSAKLFWVNKGKLVLLDTPSLDVTLLNSDRCYLLDCDAEIFVWMGRTTLVSERKTAISTIEEFMHQQDRSASIQTTFLTEGSETAKFKSHFCNWPQTVTPSLYIEGRGKVAAIFKHQGYDVKEIPEDDCRPIIDINGTLRVWRVNGHDVTPIAAVEQTVLYSGECYIIKYTFSAIGKDNNLFYAWLGCNSTLEDRVDAISLMTRITHSIKAPYVMAQVSEGKEPQLFFTIFKCLIIFKGRSTSGYKFSVMEQCTTDEISDQDKVALFRVQGSSPTSMQAIQVDPVSGKDATVSTIDVQHNGLVEFLLPGFWFLNSSYCYILQDQVSSFTWLGSLSSPMDHELVDRLLDQISPLKQFISVREGSEPDVFWNMIGGKGDYPKQKVIKQHDEDPHLFTCVFEEGDFKGKEIFNYAQDDLTTEDIILLDCHYEIYIWVGQHAKLASEEQAFSLGKKFLETDILLEGLSDDAAIYVIPEGNEPPFFTSHFAWDNSKLNIHGNSFERKLAILKGSTQITESANRGTQKAHRGYVSEGLSDYSWRTSATSDGLHAQKGSPAAMAFSNSETLDHRVLLNQTQVLVTLSLANEAIYSSTKQEALSIEDNEENSSEDNVLPTFPYELLKVTSSTTLAGIDVTRREVIIPLSPLYTIATKEILEISITVEC